MKGIEMNVLKKIIVLILIVACFLLPDKTVEAKGYFWEGKGTQEDPYLIKNFDDLQLLQERVNSGESFCGIYFQQTNDINMESIKWIPIGVDGNVFSGIYDGTGHCVTNIRISEKTADQAYALFGTVSGIIANFGIESGSIVAPLASSIVAQSEGQEALIINCYNKASINGIVASGIAYDFRYGTIACCYNAAEVKGECVYSITACSYAVKIYACLGKGDILCPEIIQSTTSGLVTDDYFNSSSSILKNNILIAVAQYMYANQRGVKLVQVQNSESGWVFSNQHTILDIVGFINYYLLTIIVLIGVFVFCIKNAGKSIYEVVNDNTAKLKAFCFVSGVVSLFLDCALVSKGTNNIHIGNGLFILLINAVFVATAIMLVKYNNKNIKLSKPDFIIILTVIFVVVCIEIAQFGLVPKFDGSLYYGSFVIGSKMFNLDLISYVGSFVCWKWIQGLALFIAPFEFLMPGKIYGFYIGNIIITVITVIIAYRLVMELYPKGSKIIAGITSLVLFLFPYEVGMITYLNMDTHLAFFAVWLIYFKLKDNDYMISFCGFLLAFTKITGVFFYVAFLVISAAYDVLFGKDNKFGARLLKYINVKRVILWTLPAILFTLCFMKGEYLTALDFFGAYSSDSSIRAYWNVAMLDVLMQSFIYGFRWVFVLLIICTVIFIHISKDKKNEGETKDTYISVLLASGAVVMLLCLYNSDANCPRYTAILNACYMLTVPFVIYGLFKKKYVKHICAGGIGILLFFQLFKTIDPAILLTSSYIDIGKTYIYRLAPNRDQRLAMNLGVDYAAGEPIMCDSYCYNLEYTYLDSLVDEMLSTIRPDETDTFFSLDMYEYQWHISGSWNRNYKIYWDQEKERRTYSDKGIYINVQNITTSQLFDYIQMDRIQNERIYVIVDCRISPQALIEYMNENDNCAYKIWRFENSAAYFDVLEIVIEN
ncbi:MAG: hypothetical protein PUA62_08035 [Lachnospiraceae bacterium]|nr:hypothetical protein [Lachnospiraceae bacterium]